MSTKDAEQLLMPLGVTVKSVKISPVKGLFEVVAIRDGKEGIVFIDFSRKYIMQGIMVKITGSALVK